MGCVEIPFTRELYVKKKKIDERCNNCVMARGNALVPSRKGFTTFKRKTLDNVRRGTKYPRNKGKCRARKLCGKKTKQKL